MRPVGGRVTSDSVIRMPPRTVRVHGSLDRTGWPFRRLAAHSLRCFWRQELPASGESWYVGSAPNMDIRSYGASPFPDRWLSTIFLDRTINFCDCSTLFSIRAIDERTSVSSLSTLSESRFLVGSLATLLFRYERERGCLSGTGAQVSQPVMHLKRSAGSLGSAFHQVRPFSHSPKRSPACGADVPKTGGFGHPWTRPAPLRGLADPIFAFNRDSPSRSPCTRSSPATMCFPSALIIRAAIPGPQRLGLF